MGKALDKPFRGDLSENIPKSKAKVVIPQSREANDEKEIKESDEEVNEIKKTQGEARSKIQVPLSFPQRYHKKRSEN